MLRIAKDQLKSAARMIQHQGQGYVSLPWTISHWYGRLGNNIQQLCCGVLAAEENNLRFISPKHEMIDRIAANAGPADRFLPKWRNRFFHYTIPGSPVADLDLPYERVLTEFRRIALQYVRPRLKLSVDHAFGDDDLVIHLRGGDVFDRRLSANGAYVQNPFAFYRRLITRHERTIIVAEPGDLNPLLPDLSTLPTVTVLSGSIQDDFSLLLGARNLASSGVGTFAVAAALCSDNLRTFYCSDRYLIEHLNPEMLVGIDVNCIRLDGYIKNGQWDNSDLQRKLMRAYDLANDIEFERLSCKNRDFARVSDLQGCVTPAI